MLTHGKGNCLSSNYGASEQKIPAPCGMRKITSRAEPQPVINISGASSFSNFTDADPESLLQ